MIPRLLPILALGLIITLAIFIHKHRKRQKRAQLQATPLAPQFIAFIEQNVAIYPHLPEKLKTELHGLIQLFLGEKTFEGCGGLEITDEIRVTIAAQACILLLNKEHQLYPNLYTIYVYPDAVTSVNRRYQNGFLVEEQTARLGESWQLGPVVLSWRSALDGGQNPADGHNVVFHEFAHQLDQEDGRSDGVPILASRSEYGPWGKILSTEFQTFLDNLVKHRPEIIDAYGATNPAEFFAVSTEIFFEQPHQLKAQHPALYDELRDYYQLNPIDWFPIHHEP